MAICDVKSSLYIIGRTKIDEGNTLIFSNRSFENSGKKYLTAGLGEIACLVQRGHFSAAIRAQWVQGVVAVNNKI
jgi:hypothetical protein